MSTRAALNEISQPTRRSRRSSAPLGDITNRESQSSQGSKDGPGIDGKVVNKRASKRKSTKVTASENDENTTSSQNSEGNGSSNPPPARRRKNENTKNVNNDNALENTEEMEEEPSDENANPNVSAGPGTSVEHVFVGQVADERYAKYKERESKILERRRASSGGSSGQAAAVSTVNESNSLKRQSSELSTSSTGNISAMSGNSSSATVNSNDEQEVVDLTGAVVAPVAQHLDLLPSHIIAKKKPHTITRPIALKTKNADPSQCIDTIDRMYELYHQMQPEYAAVPYMDRQPDINKKMRAILVDWLVEVHQRFRLQPLTLWLCVNILDRYLMKEEVLRARLQLVGISSLLIACKYEEIFPPEVKDCVSITDKAYNKEQILEMENKILMTLEYTVFVPTGYHFLCRYLNAIGAPERTRHLAYYYAERNLQEYDSLQNHPHVMAAGALYAALLKEDQLTQFVENKPTVFWNNTLVIETGLKPSELVYLAKNMVKHVSEEPETASKRRLIACKKKFSHERYNSVSTMSLPLFNVVL